MIEINKPQSNSEYKNYTGVAGFKVVAVNPTVEELKELGVSYIDKVDYIKETSNGNKISNFTFWLKALEGQEVQGSKETMPELLVSVSFGILHMKSQSSSGKPQLIDRCGKTKWVYPEDAVADNYFSNEGVRQSYIGEEDLYKFISRWLNLRFNKTAKDSALMDINKIIAGDFSEIRDTFYKGVLPMEEKIGEPFRLKCLLGVRSYENKDGDTKYAPVIYTKSFWSIKQRIDDEFIEKINNMLEGQYTAFTYGQSEVDTSVILKVYNPNEIKPDEDEAPSPDNNDGDLPF